MLWIILAIFTSYCIGSIPTAYLFCHFLKGIDIRKVGSGNVGATNALRVLGKPLGITVLLLDIAKGFICVVFVADLVIFQAPPMMVELVRILCGVASIVGHNWTIFLKFKGGKGVASTLGVLIGLAVRLPGMNLVFAFVVLTWLLVFIAFRFVSLASIIAVLSLPVYLIILKLPLSLIAAGLVLAFLGILRHSANIRRLLQGTEPRLTFRKK